jgi:putative DNA primase/helicase
MAVARRLAAVRYSHHQDLILRRWRDDWWKWETTCWRKLNEAEVESDAYEFTEQATWCNRSGNLEPWAPTRRRVGDLLEALRAICLLSPSVQPPEWIAPTDKPELPANTLLSLANGLLHIPTRTLHPHTPRLFNQVAVPFAYDPQAGESPRWLQFLNTLWPNDADSIATLQEWFGYVISGRIDLHKLLLLIGPPRAGKGVIARILEEVVGTLNVASPTLASLTMNFGLAPLIGKPVAIISDARLGGTRDAQLLVERLLTISGVGGITIDRKYREPWAGTLPTRFVIISNELPQLSDVSYAIGSRFVTLCLTQSWRGKENPGLIGELRTELPGILNWSLNGIDRLASTGHFTEPKSSHGAMTAMQDLMSPVAAFVRERCVVSADKKVPRQVLYTAWKSWGFEQGYPPLSVAQFGRDLRAVIPTLKGGQFHAGSKRVRDYRGIDLAKENASGTGGEAS